MTKERWCYLPLWVLLAISLTLVSSCQPATVGWVANPSRWEPFSQGLPSYALILAVAAHPSQPGVLYAGTYHPPGLWRSDDDGETWVKDDQGLENQPVFTLHWDPLRSRWWAGAGDGLYSRSTCRASGVPNLFGGWQPVLDLPQNPAYALAQDHAGQLYLALAGTGLFRSADGESWSPLPLALSPAEGMGQPSVESNLLALAVSPDGRDLYAGTAGDGLWISHDAGETWVSVPQMAGDYVSALLADPEAGAWAYARTLSQVYRSDDRGRTWLPVPDLDRRAYDFAYPPDDPRGAHDGLNLARLLDLRAIMEAHGDGDKPVWVTELGWTTAGVGESSWLTVTPQQQADYLTGAWRRARREWPWLQVFTVWNLSQGPRPDGSTSSPQRPVEGLRPELVEGLPPTDEKAGYSLLDESGDPKPAYHALRAEFNRQWGHRLARWVDRTQASLLDPLPPAITILAADEAVHLGDSE